MPEQGGGGIRRGKAIALSRMDCACFQCKLASNLKFNLFLLNFVLPLGGIDRGGRHSCHKILEQQSPPKFLNT